HRPGHRRQRARRAALRLREGRTAQGDTCVKAPLGLTLAALVTALAWIFGDGMSGLLTLALYLIGVAPGVLLGRTLFGRNAIAIAAGALLGYALLAFAFWIPIAAGRPGRLSFVCAWLALGLI